jgi:GT2 family glycosyltransferase
MLEVIGGMDENFELYFEDADICYRCRRAGWEVRFVPEIIAFHELGKSGKLIPRKIQLIYRQSQIYYYRMHNLAVELIMLKIYLFLKFIIVKRIWRDKVFFKYFLQILLEKKHFLLNEKIAVDL